MATAPTAELLLGQGRAAEALPALEAQVRARPADPALRVFLFQLLCVLGQWQRAMTQLNVAVELDAANLLMAQTYRPALNCEVLRREIFQGRRTPLIFGEPPDWIGLLVESLRLLAQGQAEQAVGLRGAAFDAAPPSAGSLNDQPFEWIADADGRLGPVLEAIVHGKYYWVPFQRVRRIEIDPPTDLRDVVWAPATLEWETGGRTAGLIPTRYVGSEDDADDAIRLARATRWEERSQGLFVGLGQRILTTDAAEVPLLEVRRLRIGADDREDADTGSADG